MSNNQVRAAILVIGNEILSGRTQDANIKFIAEKLSNLGIALQEVRVIQDIKTVIIDNVNVLRNNYDYVFTTGGIGPTHDDLTTESVAEAFSLEVELNQNAVKAMKRQYKERNLKMMESSLKMAMIPKGAELIDNNISGAPGFRVDNVFVLPGVPNIMQGMFVNIINQLDTGKKFYSTTLVLDVGESAIANICSAIQLQAGDVDIGSYPFVVHSKWATKLVVRGQNNRQVHNITKKLEDALQANGISFHQE